MLLSQIFSPDRIIVNLESEDKDEAFEELVNQLVVSIPGTNRQAVLNSLWEREEKMSTGIKRGIAVPHGLTNAVEGVKAVLGISKKGIDYESLDGGPVYILFMLLFSPKVAEQHLKVLRSLAYLLDDHAFYEQLTAQKSPEGVYSCICKFEEMLLGDN